ncbi:MAG: hypothetical protein QOG43_2503 [Actinomycetota bacterium]|jgi:hypothetical protein|nr:hypothetical protein [Actinomycetota bacterium]
MSDKIDYEAPALTEIGSLQELTLQFKKFGGSDGIFLVIPNNPPIPLSNLS